MGAVHTLFISAVSKDRLRSPHAHRRLTPVTAG